MKTVIPLAVLIAAMAAFAAAPELSNARTAGQDASSSSSSSSSDSGATSSAASSSADCPAKTATSQQPKPGRTTSSCSNPYVKQPGMSSSSSSLPH